MRCVYLQLSAANTYMGSTLGAKFKGCKIRKLTGDTGQCDHGAIENIKFVQVLNTTCWFVSKIILFIKIELEYNSWYIKLPTAIIIWRLKRNCLK